MLVCLCTFLWFAGVGSRDDTFYATTGMFPQEFVIKLGGPTQLSRVKVAGTHRAWGCCVALRRCVA